LVVVPAASAAPKGVINFYGGTGTLGGQFGSSSTTPTGIAVNNTTGDIYVADVNRVQRLSSSGAFISTWGKDVIQSLAPGDTGTGFEVCTVAVNCKAGTTGGLGGQLNALNGIAVDQVTGDVYVTEANNRRISVFTAAGAFIRTFGKDVVTSGSQQADERQTLTVDATAGQFKLSFGANTTVDLPYNAPASGGVNPEDSVQNALNALASINAGGGSVTVTGGPGGAGGTAPYMIVFDGGPRADTNQAALVSSAGTTPLSGGAASATVATYDDGAVGFEICTTAASCRQGATSSATPNIGTGGSGDVAVAPLGAPNAGSVLFSDSSNERVQEFTSSGQFVRMFGWDVVAAGPSNTGTGFEICRASARDICKAGVAGSGVGQFKDIRQIVVDTTGNVNTVESPGGAFRVQRFTPSGGGFTPTIFNPQVCSSPAEFLSGTTAFPFGQINDSPTEITMGPGGNPLVVKGFLNGTGCPVADQFERRILEFDSAGTLVQTHASGAGLTNLTGMAFNPALGRIYVSQTNEGGVPGVVVLGDVPPIGVSGLEATDVGASTATLRATVEPAAFALHTFYRFEYAKLGTDFWRRVPPQDVDLGNGSGGPGDPTACPEGNPSVCEVSQDVSALDFDTSYKFRLVAHAQFNGGLVTVDGPEFTTFATAPKVTTSPALWSSPPATGPTLLLSGIVNPSHDRTTYQFQYVSEGEFAASGFAAATAVPVEPGEAGNGTQEVAVTRVVADLDSTQSYRFRLVATNSVGTTEGAVLAVDPPEPGDRFFEWVSRGDSHGFGVKPSVNDVADSGDRAVFDSTGFGQPEALPGPSNFYVADRTGSGWEVRKPMIPDADHIFSGGIVGGSSSLISSELDSTLSANTTLAQLESGIQQFGLFGLDGSAIDASPRLVPVQRANTGSPSGAFLLGASGDLSSYVFQPYGQTVTLFPDEALPAGNFFNLYKVSGAGTANPVVSIVNRANGANGAVLGGDCGGTLGGTLGASLTTESRAVSVDGSVVYFTARPDEPVDGSCPAFLAAPARLFKRVGNATTVAVSQSQCTRVAPACDTTEGNDSYRGASADGSVVVFSTNRQVADSDLDTGFGCDNSGSSGTAGCDLYLYDSSPPAGQPNLVQISAGEVVPGDHPTVGSGAAAQGVLDVSADGSRVYFVASGRLTSAATQGANNLYVYERDDAHPGGRIAFIAALAGSDAGDWSNGGSTIKASSARPSEGVSGDGHALFLLSAAKLVAEDTDSVNDLYRYDDGSSELICLSCAGNGPFKVGVNGRYDQQKSFADYTQGAPLATADVSTAVFATAEQLLPEDQNSVADVYTWDDGALSLISGVTGKFGTDGDPGISLDGNSVFFVTRAPLAPADTNGVNDMYVARIDGGFPATPSIDPCGVLAGACQGQGAPPPPPAKPISSATFSGSGNVKEKPKRCKKGKKLRGGKCVKKKSVKKHKRANANRRASR
jgi:hypothetical protein